MSTLSGSCGKDSYSYIPNVPVYLELNVNTDLANLGIGQLLTIDSLSTGSSLINYHNLKLSNIRIGWRVYGNGLVLYRKDLNTYEVYDRTCTYNGLTKHCAVDVKIYEFTSTCPCCKSVFLMNQEGVPSQGSLATTSLVQYYASLDGTGKLILSK